ncbi:SIMPL domain-containing protein [uncultured Kushneria sp.]|uniref:SIMPL domain-containing protein n=1 Tax=uncultured Kushneria sp. TaxID=905033 RepID=UPI0026398753|nr:SIMPL domain-containing protein [uncultured Kushneria sp.]
MSISLRLPTLLALLALSLPALPVTAAETPSSRQIEVQASASIDVLPDRATLNAVLVEATPLVEMGSERNGDDTAKAREKLEKRSTAVINALRKMGIDSDHLHAGNLSVYNEQQLQGDDQAAPLRERVIVQRNLDIDINDLTALPGIIDALFANGIDRLEGIRYDVSDREGVEDKALKQALARAHQKAELMAGALSVTLGDVERIQETRSPVFRPMMMATARSEQADSATYTPGTISVDAGVLVNWSIDASSAKTN